MGALRMPATVPTQVRKDILLRWLPMVLESTEGDRKFDNLMTHKRCAEQRKTTLVQSSLDTDEILLVNLRVLADQLPCDPTILCKHQQPSRIDVETPGRSQAFQMRRLETWRIGGGMLILRQNQFNGRDAPRLRLSGNIADRLVQNNRHLALL